jgi:hypothetical protein
VNILFATPVQPFANKPRPHHLIKSLAARGHSVHLLAQASSWREVDGVTEDPRWRPVQDPLAGPVRGQHPHADASPGGLLPFP